MKGPCVCVHVGRKSLQRRHEKRAEMTVLRRAFHLSPWALSGRQSGSRQRLIVSASSGEVLRFSSAAIWSERRERVC